ncbi:MAG TPA: histone deacetylase [Spirochaetia bacterium]|nr:histone deacetylase [Spirochaetia bacterium]
MILGGDRTPFTFYDYGIDIPVSKDKREKVLNVLRSNPLLESSFNAWFTDRPDEEITSEDLLRVHSKEYVNRLFSPRLEAEVMKTYELLDDDGNSHRYDPKKQSRPLTHLFDRALRTTAGSYHCCKIALQTGFCFFLGGGMHHAQRDTGNGFCLINDVVISIRKLQAGGLVRNAWVIDLDVHKGDGTASLTEGDRSITTLSIHMAKGWPLDGEEFDAGGRLNPSFVPSDIDIPIDVGEEHIYVERLKSGLERLPPFGTPDIALVLSGADPYEKDELPSTALMRLTREQLFERDRLVYTFLRAKKIPGAYLMAGGYGKSSWEIYTRFLEWVLIGNLEGPG